MIRAVSLPSGASGVARLASRVDRVSRTLCRARDALQGFDDEQLLPELIADCFSFFHSHGYHLDSLIVP